jgi:hypothetical protein
VNSFTSRFFPRPATADDRASIRDLFFESFGHAMTPEWQAWKYQTLGGLSEVLIDGKESNKLVAHYGGFPRKMVDPQGQRINVLQIGDVMVSPRLRGILGKRGPFLELAESFLERYVGIREPKESCRYRWVYGFPNIRHMRIGQTHRLYSDTGSLWQCKWDLAEHKVRHNLGPTDTTIALRQVRSREELGSLGLPMAYWSALMAKTWNCILIERDLGWWDKRYFQWPAYSIWAHERIGCIALRFSSNSTDSDNTATIEWLDGITSPDKWSELIDHTLGVARSFRASQLICWANDLVERKLRQYSSLCFHAEKVSARVGGSYWLNPSTMTQFWAMGGDSDFR